MSVRSQAWGQCGKSGQRMLLADMVEDGYYPGMLVHPDWYEQPDQARQRVPLFDKESLKRPAPSNDHQNHTVRFPLFDFDTFEAAPPLVGYTYVGNVSYMVGANPAGVQISSAQGSVNPTVIPNISGNNMTIGLGTPAPFNGDLVYPTGQAVTSSLGTVSKTIIPTISGQVVVTSLGTPTIFIDETFWGSGTWGSGGWGS